jgi:hypothetical protein
MCIVVRFPCCFSSFNKSDLGFQSFIIPLLILAMGVGAMVLGGALLPRSICRPLIRSFEVPIQSWFEVTGGCSATLAVGQWRPSLWSWPVSSSGGSPCASTASSPPSRFTYSSLPGTWIVQADALLRSPCDLGYGVDVELVCRMKSSPTTISARTELDLSGVMQVHESAHERWDHVPISHFPLSLELLCLLRVDLCSRLVLEMLEAY